jgi:hypothetical protein
MNAHDGFMAIASASCLMMYQMNSSVGFVGKSMTRQRWQPLGRGVQVWNVDPEKVPVQGLGMGANDGDGSVVRA